MIWYPYSKSIEKSLNSEIKSIDRKSEIRGSDMQSKNYEFGNQSIEQRISLYFW